MKTLRSFFVSAGFAFSLMACGASARIRPPLGFAVVGEDSAFNYRAMNANGLALAIHSAPNSPKGNVDFWSAVIERKLENQGYTLDKPAFEVRAAKGQTGRQYQFAYTSGGRKYRYWIAIFVTDSKVWLVEAGGDADWFDPATETAVQEAIASAQFG